MMKLDIIKDSFDFSKESLYLFLFYSYLSPVRKDWAEGHSGERRGVLGIRQPFHPGAWRRRNLLQQRCLEKGNRSPSRRVQSLAGRWGQLVAGNASSVLLRESVEL